VSRVLECRDLEIGYRLGRRRVRSIKRDLSFELVAGELVCLLGANGAGKSTLLRTLAGMQEPLGGTVWLLGDELRGLPPRELARRISVVLTEPVDAGALSARGLVELGRTPYTGWLGRMTADDRERVESALAQVGGTGLAEREFRTLSDGERQRILIARALAQQPKLMVLDEPTAYLDLPSRLETLSLLRDLVSETGVTVLLATHHLDLALEYADRLWLFPAGPEFEDLPRDHPDLGAALIRTFSTGAVGIEGVIADLIERYASDGR
jgi:iron complex transport system ATP-binding protein